MAEFKGFSLPYENWSKLPNDLIDSFSLVSTLSELKVILYILRHTWGYQEFETSKRITTDEFANGRKKADGTRLDNGVCMSEPSIRDGLSRAVEHGFIIVDVNSDDLARVEKSYRLNMSSIQGERNLPPGENFLPPGERNLPPYIERNSGKKPKKDLPSDVSEQKALIDAWVKASEMIDMGQTFATASRLRTAKELLKWDVPPTPDEINKFVSSEVKAGRKVPEFVFIADKLSTWRSTSNKPRLSGADMLKKIGATEEVT